MRKKRTFSINSTYLYVGIMKTEKSLKLNYFSNLFRAYNGGY